MAEIIAFVNWISQLFCYASMISLCLYVVFSHATQYHFMHKYFSKRNFYAIKILFRNIHIFTFYGWNLFLTKEFLLHGWKFSEYQQSDLAYFSRYLFIISSHLRIENWSYFSFLSNTLSLAHHLNNYASQI